MEDHNRRHVVLVDDDSVILTLLGELFVKESFHVSKADNAAALRRILTEKTPDLVVLDINLPDESGFLLAQEIRAKSQAGLIMITSRQEEVDRLIGLELGADDYLTKPFNERELLTRARNLLRRVPLSKTTNIAPSQRVFRFGTWRFHPFKHLLESEMGARATLTRAESDLLFAMIQRPQIVFSRQQLLDAIHGRTAGSGDRTIDVLILRLRRKLGEDPREPRIINTVPGTGYYFAASVESDRNS